LNAAANEAASEIASGVAPKCANEAWNQRTIHPAHVDSDAFVPALQQNAQQSAAVIEPDLWAAHLFVTCLERALVEDNGIETVDDLRAGRRVCAGAGYADWAEAGGHCVGCVSSNTAKSHLTCHAEQNERKEEYLGATRARRREGQLQCQRCSENGQSVRAASSKQLLQQCRPCRMKCCWRCELARTLH
jgi:hypothetical protein